HGDLVDSAAGDPRTLAPRAAPRAAALRGRRLGHRVPAGHVHGRHACAGPGPRPRPAAAGVGYRRLHQPAGLVAGGRRRAAALEARLQELIGGAPWAAMRNAQWLVDRINPGPWRGPRP